jgi:hypothetical protein
MRHSTWCGPTFTSTSLEHPYNHIAFAPAGQNIFNQSAPDSVFRVLGTFLPVLGLFGPFQMFFIQSPVGPKY